MKNGERKSRGRRSEDASFPVAPRRGDMPEHYAAILGEIKKRIRSERLHVVMAANASMVLLYWDIGLMILERQEKEGWGAKAIDRLSADLRDAFPDMQGLSPRNLKYMRAFAAAWPDRKIVQEVLAQITWYHNVALLEKVRDPHVRLWYARKGLEEGWSRNVLAMQIESRLYDRQGKAITNFPITLPPGDSDMAVQVFKDPYLFDFLGTADPRRDQRLGAGPVQERRGYRDPARQGNKGLIGILEKPISSCLSIFTPV